jgi:hypothetical protein
VVQLLLDYGADMEMHQTGCPPLTSAADAGRDTIIKLLLARDTPAPIPDAAIAHAIFRAIDRAHTTTLRLLLAKKPCMGWKDGPLQRTFLHHAACHGLPSIVSILVEHGADLEERDTEGNTALLCAARYGTTGVAKFLLRKGADIEARCCENRTAIQYAKIKGNGELTKALLSHDATLPSKDPRANFSLGSLQQWHRTRSQGRACFFASGSI